MSEELNELLDTDLDFSRMKKDDLELLYDLADEGHLIEPLAKHEVKERGEETLEEIVDDYYVGKYLSMVI